MKMILNFCLAVSLVMGAIVDASAKNAELEPTVHQTVAKPLDQADDMQANTAVPVPEPSAIALVFAGALTLVGMRVLRRRAQFDF